MFQAFSYRLESWNENRIKESFYAVTPYCISAGISLTRHFEDALNHTVNSWHAGLGNDVLSDNCPRFSSPTLWQIVVTPRQWLKPLTGFLYLTKHKLLLVSRRLGSYCGGFRSERRRFYYWGDTVSRCWCEIRDRAASDAISVEIKWSPERERCFAPKQEVYYWLMNYTIQIDETREIFLVTIFFNLPTRWSKQEMIAFF